MSEKNSQSRVTLEDLLRLKRAERPPEAFWAQFEKDLHTRQLAAAVEQKRWWFGLSRAFTGLSRYQAPMGAAAVLAVTFLTLNNHREPGLEVVVSPQADVAATSTVLKTVSDPSAEPLEVVNLDELRAGTAVTQVATPAPVPVETRSAVTREVAPLVPWGTAETAERTLSPSARSIAANLAAATDVRPEWEHLLGNSGASANARIGARAEPLAQVASPNDMRRERLFAYSTQLASLVTASDDRATPGRERLATRLSDEQLYETVSRMGGAGDRLTLKF